MIWRTKLTRWLVWIVVIALLVAATGVSIAQAQNRTHTVQPGDTLFSIARRYGVTVQDIAFANGITNPALIYVGQVLIIPGGSGGTPSEYVVVAGDTLFSIARRFNTTVDAIAALNNITDPSLISVGQRLQIPGGTQQPTATPTTPTATATPTQQPDTQVTHTVQAGETLYRIALRYGVTVQQIVQLNNIANPNLIAVGQVLIIKQGSTGTPPPSPTTATPTEEASPSPTSTEETPTQEVTPTPTEEASTNTPTATATSTEVAAITPTPTNTPAGSLGFATPTPIAPVIVIPDTAPNLLTNPDFEGSTRPVGFNTIQVFEGWEPFYCDLPYTSEKCPALNQGSGNPQGLMMGRPEFRSTNAAGRVQSGSTAQHWLCMWTTCRAGVFQTVNTTPGATCEAGAYVQSWSANGDSLTSTVTNNSLWFIRVNLAGGTYAFSNDSNTQISRAFDYADGHYDQYVKISYRFQATGNRTTVFFENLRYWPVANNDSFIDSAYVRCNK
ncbi:MAG: hypothetical protein Kow00124_06880 [Anaerolineae bacterium]